MRLEGHNHCFMHFLASKHCLGTLFAPPLRKPGYGTRTGNPKAVMTSHDNVVYETSCMGVHTPEIGAKPEQERLISCAAACEPQREDVSQVEIRCNVH